MSCPSRSLLVGQFRFYKLALRTFQKSSSRSQIAGCHRQCFRLGDFTPFLDFPEFHLALDLLNMYLNYLVITTLSGFLRLRPRDSRTSTANHCGSRGACRRRSRRTHVTCTWARPSPKHFTANASRSLLRVLAWCSSSGS